MQKRTIEKHIRLNEKEAADWKRKCELTGLPLSTIIRMLMNGFEPKEKPDLRFYETMNQVTEFTSELRRFRLQAQHQNRVDIEQLKKMEESWQQLQLDLELKYLVPEPSFIWLKEKRDRYRRRRKPTASAE
ncbi:hypothetical protein [Ruminococcus sp.]|uniref:hypothetical protein n=1 Tax=Ruminococcus sp. TaxID=41978 RepID=UPI00388DF743